MIVRALVMDLWSRKYKHGSDTEVAPIASSMVNPTCTPQVCRLVLCVSIFAETMLVGTACPEVELFCAQHMISDRSCFGLVWF